MFRGGDENALSLQAGGVADSCHVAADSVHFKAVQVNPAEDNARSGWRRDDSESHRSAAMQPNSFALNGRPNCLFKWQVIPTKQITPGRL